MANTVTLNYSDSGHGTPLVLLHGFPLSAITSEHEQGDTYAIGPEVH